jgi:dipeptidyl aminopeptidase/acylaminoacyl peptidase
MTLMAIGKAPSLWAAGVEAYGVIDSRAMLLHDDVLDRQYEEALLGDPVKDNAVTGTDAARTTLLSEFFGEAPPDPLGGA